MNICTREALEAYARAACVGSQIVYYTADNASGYRGLDLLLKENPTRLLVEIVNRVRQLYNAGQVDLVQDRSEARRTRYIAIWRQYPAIIMGDGLLPMIGGRK